MLQGIEDAAEWTLAKIQRIQRQIVDTQDLIKRKLPKIYSQELLEILFSQPYCRIADLVNSGVCQRQTASTHLKGLVGIGVLEEEKVGREKVFLHRAFLGALMEETHES